MKHIPITKPYFDDKELKAVEAPIKAGWLVQGEAVKEFEHQVALFTGAKYAAAVTSCTTALHIALIAAGIKPGDEVILPSLTFVASANAIEYMGAKPVFIDIDIRTFNIDPSKTASAITKKTKAMMPVHLFGLSADMDPIMKIARRHKLKVIEDAACAIGSFYKNKHAGTIGDTGCFSFHPRKLITCGEGGMVLTNSAKTNTLLRCLRDHGASTDDLARHKQSVSLLPSYKILGYNYRMTDLQAAIAVEQMKKLPAILADRIKKANYYNSLLKDVKFITAPFVPQNCTHAYQAYVCLVDNKNLKTLKQKSEYRNKLMEHLKNKGISTRLGTHCVPSLDYYKKKYKIKTSNYAESLKAEYLSMALPLYYELTKQDQEYIAAQIRGFMSKG